MQITVDLAQLLPETFHANVELLHLALQLLNVLARTFFRLTWVAVDVELLCLETLRMLQQASVSDDVTLLPFGLILVAVDNGIRFLSHSHSLLHLLHPLAELVETLGDVGVVGEIHAVGLRFVVLVLDRRFQGSCLHL